MKKDSRDELVNQIHDLAGQLGDVVGVKSGSPSDAVEYSWRVHQGLAYAASNIIGDDNNALGVWLTMLITQRVMLTDEMVRSFTELLDEIGKQSP